MEIGPLGGDEINILEAGANYGWPLVSRAATTRARSCRSSPGIREGMEMPRMFWVPQISPAGMAWYSGDRFPDWKNSLIVGALSGQQVQRIMFNQPGQAERREVMLRELGVRFRDVEQGPDGLVYLATEVRYGSGQPDGTVLKIEPAD